MLKLRIKIFLQESYSSKIIESLHIFILMEDQSPQKTSEKVINLFKTRYMKVRDLFKSMDDFLLVSSKLKLYWRQFFSNERSLVDKLSTYLTKNPLLSNDLQRIIALNLLDAHIEYFTNFSSESLLKKVAEKSPDVFFHNYYWLKC